MTDVPIIDLLCKSMDWFLYDRDLHHERVNPFGANFPLYFNIFQYSKASCAKDWNSLKQDGALFKKMYKPFNVTLLFLYPMKS